MWQTWVQSWAQVTSLQLDYYIFVIFLLWLCMKDREASEICAFFLCAILWSHRFVGSFQPSLFLSHFMAWPSWINCKNVILDVIVVLICLHLKFRVANCEAWDEFTDTLNRPKYKMAKEMRSKQHKFQSFQEISQSFIYTYKMVMWNVNDITWTRDWTQA